MADDVPDDHGREEAARVSYDRVAEDYARRINDELEHKPLERRLLDQFAAETRGLICDAGCGPGHVAAYLQGHGAQVAGLDLSGAMVAEARRLHPTVRFERGSMRALPYRDGALGGIVALYSLIHFARGEVVGVLREFRRALAAGGWLLVGFHIGDETRHVAEWWGAPVDLDATYFQPEEMAGYLERVGFAVEAVIERAPYPEIEVQTRRAYLLARAPAAAADATAASPR